MWKTGTESSMTQMLMTTETTMPQRTSPLAKHCTTERAHVVLFLAQNNTLTLAQVLCALSHPSPCHTREWLSLFDSTYSTLNFPAFLLSVFLFPFFHFSDEQHPELNKKIMENLCDSANNGGVRAPTTSSTSPQVMSPTAMTSTSSRTHQSPSPSRSLPRTRTWMT